MDTLFLLWQLDTLARAMDHISNPDNEPFRLQNFIENQFLDLEHTSGWIDSVCPRSGDLLMKVPVSPENVVEYAVTVASRAFTTWSTTTPLQRSEILLRIASLLEEKKDMFTVWESISQGKRLVRAQFEVDRSIEQFRYYAKFILQDENNAMHINKGSGQTTLTYEHRVPVGVYAMITSSNMPLYLLTSQVAACLAFGCTGVAKPSEYTSMTAFLFAKVLHQAELPPGVMNIIFGNGPVTGASLVASPLVQGVSFNGGNLTAIQIRKNTAAHVHKRLSFELRGNGPVLVFGDVDVDDAVSTAAKAAFENTGQLCLSGSRIYVHQSVYKMFLAKLVRSVRKHYWAAKDLGPVVSREHYDKVRAHLLHAKEMRARFEIGGIPAEDPTDGFWINATVLSNVPTNSAFAHTEIFGPVTIAYQFDTEDEVINLCNGNPNGMGAVILTNDLSRMRRVGERLDAELTWGNCSLGRELGAGHNDTKATGTGREGGARTRDAFTRLRNVHVPAY
ncbi:Aldehyde/histidinol dehydrogenase [Penicillium cf. griseofulvum]|uniref:Aldehyde/histidinol dehydrogenase n=1 Tax=Penicillium cf. griseofulvum TaxID=2972120 RepID=A0A9W9M1N3_9EURO|nr:Aldehyde/histidinol dehydrogenase [Penicillium cf. griseofulvum]KAJ5429420.1 Aldehyde/histidinol dehydrogenase [Penicillium cf. griseofulvum]